MRLAAHAVLRPENRRQLRIAWRMRCERGRSGEEVIEARSREPGFLDARGAKGRPYGEISADRQRDNGLNPRDYFAGRVVMIAPGLTGLTAVLGCLSFFFSLRRSLLPMIVQSFEIGNGELLCHFGARILNQPFVGVKRETGRGVPGSGVGRLPGARSALKKTTRARQRTRVVST